MTCLPIARRLLYISNIFINERIYNSQLSTDKKESEQMTVNLLSSEEVTYPKARNIDLDFALVIELADSNRRQ